MRSIIVLGAAIFSFDSVFSQDQSSSSDFLAKAKLEAAANYGNLYGDRLQLYNGRAYHEILVNEDLDEGNPFFLRAEFELENVRYNNVNYTDVPLVYDVLQNMVVTKFPESNLKIALVNTRVQEFTLSGHRFVRVNPENELRLEPGFYDVLYDGMSKVYAKRYKKQTQSNHDWEIRKHYVDKTELYLVKDNTAYKIKNQKSILAVFGKKNETMKTVLKQASKQSNKDKELMLVKVAEAYDSMKD